MLPLGFKRLNIFVCYGSTLLNRFSVLCGQFVDMYRLLYRHIVAMIFYCLFLPSAGQKCSYIVIDYFFPACVIFCLQRKISNLSLFSCSNYEFTYGSSVRTEFFVWVGAPDITPCRFRSRSMRPVCSWYGGAADCDRWNLIQCNCFWNIR
jgi:hypothetical protein